MQSNTNGSSHGRSAAGDVPFRLYQEGDRPSTVSDYGSIIDGRLIPFFGDLDMSKIDAVKVDGYISHATASGMTPKTIKNHLGLLRVMIKVAKRWRIVHSNPVDDAEMPRVDVPEMSILTEAEIAALLATYRRLEQDAEQDKVPARPSRRGVRTRNTKLARDYMRPALTAAGITKPFRPWHDLRHTALTHEAAAGNPHAYVQAKAGHSQSTITDRYIHAAQVMFPGAAAKAEERMFGVAG